MSHTYMQALELARSLQRRVADSVKAGLSPHETIKNLIGAISPPTTIPILLCDEFPQEVVSTVPTIMFCISRKDGAGDFIITNKT